MAGLSRRDFVKLGGGLAMAGASGVLVAGCEGLSTAPASSGGPAGSAVTGKEAPMLAALVKQGKLPALADRLPKSPVVLKPFDGPGAYGGTMKRAVISPTDSIGGYQIVSHAGLIEWNAQETKEVPALVESWEISNGGKTYTLHLRQGARWSDGQPFTTDDLVFVYKNVFGNKTLNPEFPQFLAPGGKTSTIRQLDTYSFALDFQTPNGFLLAFLAFPGRGMTLLAPKHYLSKFHPDFVPIDQLTAAAKKAGFATWDQLFKNQSNPWLNPDLPVVGPWQLTQPMTGSNSQGILERNPYYWKVDTKGRQLPYIDRITVELIPDQQTLALRAANGEIDWQDRDMYFGDVTVLVKDGPQNGYRVLHWGIDELTVPMQMNQSHLDPVMRKLMQDLNFRAGLSLAINRPEMNRALYAGAGGYVQPTTIPPDPMYEPSFGHKYIKYDQAKANQLLDQAGLDKKDSNGVRLRPDGKPISLTILTFPYETGINAVDAYQYVSRYWNRVGVPTTVSNINEDLWSNRVEASQFDCAGYTIDALRWELEPEAFVPVSTACYFAPLFGAWYATAGQSGMEPTPEMKQLIAWYDQMTTSADTATQVSLGKKILQAHSDNIWMIGTITQPFQPVIVSSDMTNVQEKSVDSYHFGHESIGMPEQLAYRHPERHTS